MYSGDKGLTLPREGGPDKTKRNPNKKRKENKEKKKKKGDKDMREGRNAAAKKDK